MVFAQSISRLPENEAIAHMAVTQRHRWEMLGAVRGDLRVISHFIAMIPPRLLGFPKHRMFADLIRFQDNLLSLLY